MGVWTSMPVSALRANQAILKQEFILEDNQKGRMSAFLSLSAPHACSPFHAREHKQSFVNLTVTLASLET